MPEFPRFPKLPPMVVKQLAAMATEGKKDEEGEPLRRTDMNTGEVTKGKVTRPWDLGELVGEFADEVFGWLDEVVLWHNDTYAWQENQLVPPCWREHPGLALDLAGWAFARIDVYASSTPGFVNRWHGEWDDWQRRMRNAVGDNPGRDCRTGKHNDPGDYTRRGVRKLLTDGAGAA